MTLRGLGDLDKITSCSVAGLLRGRTKPLPSGERAAVLYPDA